MTSYGRQHCVHCETVMTTASVYCGVCGTWQAAHRGFYESRSHRDEFGIIDWIDWDAKTRCALVIIVLIVAVWFAFTIF